MLDSDSRWYQDAIIYELHVRSFHDGIGDGMGDFRGLAQKLDYLQDLGITAIWLLPFYPSPLRDDGYDIADYTDVHPHFGKLRDFQELLDAAHRRGLRVITELVINHTSDQHPWFQRARRAARGSPERDFYVWSDTAERYKDARIIFKDFEHSNWSWDPVAKAYYWHRFYAHQPDLNYDNPAVWNAIFPVVDFWLEMGVDGMRLDAVPYLFEREGTSCENLPETHTFLKALRRHVDEKYPNRMLLAEANQWPEDAVAYFGAGDESHMAFHFPLMPRMFMSIHMEDRFPIMDILAQTPAIPEVCQWCLFLRNHDELTLEMVTDEERDYMYRAYASDARARVNLGIRHRLAPLLGNNRRRIELMNGLLLSLPGTPVIYYGDEIGMGDNIYLGDRNGVRTPMQWSADRNAGFSRANPQKLFLPIIIDPEYHYEAINVEAQQNNPNSLLWWMKRLIALRKRHKAFSRGSLEFLQPANRKILAFLRHFPPHQTESPGGKEGDEHILVVANLSRFVQHFELDLSNHQGLAPVELFGRNAFPRIGKQPYPLTLGPHAFYWFVLASQPAGYPRSRPSTPEADLPVIVVQESWEEVFRTPLKSRLEVVLTEHLPKSRWIGDRVPSAKSAVLRQAYRIRYDDGAVFACVLEVEFIEGPPERFVLPLALAQGDSTLQLHGQALDAAVARLEGGAQGILFDALNSPSFCQVVLQAIADGKSFALGDGELMARHFGPADGGAAPAGAALTTSLDGEDQTNTSVRIGDRILKFYRRLQEGIHPEVEVGRYLTEKAALKHVAPVLGVIEFRRRKPEATTLAVLHGFVANEGTAWQYTLDELSRYFERILALPAAAQQVPAAAQGTFFDLADRDMPALVHELIGRYLESAALLGQRTAELHVALAKEGDDPAFTPEPFTHHYQRSIYQSMRNVHRRALDQLRQHLENLPDNLQGDGQRVLGLSEVILERFRSLLDRRFTGQRIRCHGDYNLCEVLYTGKDFVIIDFEGEQGRSLADRRTKRSPLRDVATMLRSFHYAAFGALLGEGNGRGRVPGLIRSEDIAILEPWAWTWYLWVSATFLKGYLALAEPAGFLPGSRAEIQALLAVFLLEKSLHELRHELEFRPHWVAIPLRGLLQLVQTQP
ncbi:MAG: maltose alpha-D-glucosyltransferase [Gemmataceae bacterium]|nr:maltose alpha-D-glucosyltransferase [Gemmataceae bacterium]